VLPILIPKLDLVFTEWQLFTQIERTPRTAERVMDVFAAQVREQGAACVLVTHSRAAAARADRVLMLTASGINEVR